MDNDDRKIILLFGNDASCNPQDERGRTPFHDLALTQGESPKADEEFACGAKQMIEVLNSSNKIEFSILDKDKEGNTAIDLALKINPEVEAVKKIFIKFSLIADPKLVKPFDLTPSLSAFWDDELIQTNTSNKTSNTAAFFQTPSSNSATYDEQNVQSRPRFN